MNQGPEDPTDELGSETGRRARRARLRCGAPPVGQNCDLRPAIRSHVAD